MLIKHQENIAPPRTKRPYAIPSKSFFCYDNAFNHIRILSSEKCKKLFKENTTDFSFIFGHKILTRILSEPRVGHRMSYGVPRGNSQDLHSRFLRNWENCPMERVIYVTMAPRLSPKRAKFGPPSCRRLITSQTMSAITKPICLVNFSPSLMTKSCLIIIRQASVAHDLTLHSICQSIQHS